MLGRLGDFSLVFLLISTDLFVFGALAIEGHLRSVMLVKKRKKETCRGLYKPPTTVLPDLLVITHVLAAFTERVLIGGGESLLLTQFCEAKWWH